MMRSCQPTVRLHLFQSWLVRSSISKMSIGQLENGLTIYERDSILTQTLSDPLCLL
ncbi:uncharacterized protein N7469_008048 [Penicillium citrinum]|uniref:Uncharacterized protein n=1 Tax=Penicillium citrinum TaxID=5077 RepID=A0A9W9NR09_PENCI|nr:uncharacterized protein N7469_008048 [Penicillium citrinum]KAJ5224545.1 hypothetical protein N7469_008048 [Penicillium citrinum]